MYNNLKIKIFAVFVCILFLVTVIPAYVAVNLAVVKHLPSEDNEGGSFVGSADSTKVVNGSDFDLDIDISGGVGVKAVITNRGRLDVKSIPWFLSVKGGFLGQINMMITGFIDLSAGGSVIIGKRMFVGFGPIVITLKVADEEQTMTGAQFLHFTLLQKSTVSLPVGRIDANETGTTPLKNTTVPSTNELEGPGTVTPSVPAPRPTYYSLSVDIEGNGTVAPSKRGTYVQGTKVDVIATPDAGWEFAGWSGDSSMSDTKITLTMNADKNVKANFKRNSVRTYTLTVNAGAGGTTTPSGIHTYSSGTTVDCYATPQSGFHFTAWSGDYTGTANPYRVRMRANYRITANFEANAPNYFTLTTTVVGTGCSLTKNPNQASYANGTVVTVTAVPAAGWTFSSWSGAISGTAQSTSLIINGNKAVTATFTQNRYMLTVSVAAGVGTVTKNPNYSTYTYGTSVMLTAVPAAGYVFGGWGGDVTGFSNPVTLTMNGNKRVSPTFTLIPSEQPGDGKQVKTFMVAYFTPTLSQQDYIAEHIDLLDMGGSDGTYSTISPMKALNPDLKVITYRELNGEYGPPSPNAHDDWEEVNTHEDWFLHSISGSRLITAGTSYHYSMNPNPAVGWNQHGANVIAQYLATYPLIDGVFLDNAGRYWGSFGSIGNILDTNGNHLSLSDIPQTVQSQYPFSGSVEAGDWVYSAINTIKATNPGKIIMGNSGTSWDLADNLGMWLCIEGFSDDKHWGTQEYQLYILNECEAGITSNTNIVVICTHSLAPTAANREAIRFWAISHYALFCLAIKDPARSYFCFQSSYGSPYPADVGYWYSELDTPLGDPLGPKQLIAGNANDGVYMRRFENATILRNLSMGGGQGTQKTYTVTVDGIQYTLGPEEGKIITT